MERILMRLEVVKGETLGQLNVCFRKKIQLEEELEENEVQIHFKRGLMEGLARTQAIIDDIQKSDQLEEKRQAALSKLGTTDHLETVDKVPTLEKTHG